jgi:DNA mismatch repair ATPase MutS
MQPDATTLKDLSVFAQGTQSIFDLIDKTTTQMGREALRRHVQHPPQHYHGLLTLQQSVAYLAAKPHVWTPTITNGTVVMLEKFFESADSVAVPPAGVGLMFGSVLLKLFNKQEYFFTQFSISHLADFLRGCRELLRMLDDDNLSPGLAEMLTDMKEEIGRMRLADALIAIHPNTPFKELSKLSFAARREMKAGVYRLMQQYAQLDAWHSMARATTAHQWVFPELLDAHPVKLHIEGFYHPLLPSPITYNLEFSEGQAFMLLTGANMSGKTTFMRAIGVCALLGHIGMGIPAAQCTLSFMEGIVTNMHVEDNLIKGESYFFAEVMRMKHTAEKMLRPLPHLVLMDELFKGTNVHDAYECTRAVIEGLLMHKQHIIVLSTHLYEVAQGFKDDDGIQFSYFVTHTNEAESSYRFTYELKPGISNDRIGYSILKREGVIDLLRRVV